MHDNISPATTARSIAETARQLGVSMGFLRLEIARGKLRPTRLGRRVLILDQELRRYLSEHTR